MMFILLCVSCSSKTEKNTAAFLEVTDSYQRKVVLAEKPQRIISISPSVTEILYLLQADSLLVGVSNFCNYPPQTQEKEKIGGLQNINIERIVQLKPDLVVVGSIVSRDFVRKVENLSIPILIMNEEKGIEGVKNSISILADIVQKKELAQQLLAHYDSVLFQIKSNQPKEQKSVYYVVGFGEGGDFSAGGNTHIDEIITLAGGKNICGTLSGWSVNREYLFQQDPQYIFIRTEDLDRFSSMIPYTQLTAVQEKRIFPIESGWIDIVSPRNLDAITHIHQKLYE